MIISRLADKSEAALKMAEKKYGAELKALAFRITGSREDAAECLNDALMAAWNSVSSQNPENLHAYLVRITRNIALDRLRKSTAQKRNAVSVAIDELAECLPDSSSAAELLEKNELDRVIKNWLGAQSDEKRAVFVRRYYLLETVSEIARATGIKEKTLSGTLTRLRASLKRHLEENGYTV